MFFLVWQCFYIGTVFYQKSLVIKNATYSIIIYMHILNTHTCIIKLDKQHSANSDVHYFIQKKCIHLISNGAIEDKFCAIYCV